MAQRGHGLVGWQDQHPSANQDWDPPIMCASWAGWASVGLRWTLHHTETAPRARAAWDGAGYMP